MSILKVPSQRDEEGKDIKVEQEATSEAAQRKVTFQELSVHDTTNDKEE